MRSKAVYRWVTNKEGAREIRWSVIVETPWALDASAISTTTANATVRAKGNRFLLETSSMETIVSLPEGRQLKLLWRSQSPMLIDENCQKSSLAFLPEATEKMAAKTPFYIGVSCVQKNEQVTLHLSFPYDVELARASLFESIGKGESYRVYELKKITAAKAALGQFVFSYKDRNFNYSLFSQRGETNDNKIPKSRFTFAAGGGSMSLKTTTATYKDTKPFAVLALRPQTVLSQFALGINFESSIGSADSSNVNSLSYFQVSSYVTYRWNALSFWEIQPRFYYVVSNQSSGSGIGYQTGQFGAGLLNAWKLTDRLSFIVEAMTEAISSPVITEHSFIEISLFYRDEGLESGWTFANQIQSYTVSDSLKNVRKFDQSFVVLKRSF
tara:strand:+ start:7885 stop:9036 length:1152 start_codon:yes stop_codon:yes gene_type:complete